MRLRDEMDFASKAKELTEELNHRLYVLNVEEKWDAGTPVYANYVFESYDRLARIMEEWRSRR